MGMFDDLEPVAERGVVSITTCSTCGGAEPVLGLPGKGRPLSTFAPDYFCHGHALFV